MNCEVVSLTNYKSVINQTLTVFHGHEFNVLNSSKCDELIYMLFKDSKYRAGIIFGREDANLKSPFSAPYGGISFLKELKPEVFKEILLALNKKLKEKRYRSIEITLPPLIYNPSEISKIVQSFYTTGFDVKAIDLNNHLELSKTKSITQLYNRNARRNYNSISSKDFNFFVAKKLNQKKEAYKVLKKNRESNGYELKMGFEEILKTLKIINGDFLGLSYKGKVICSALVYEVSKYINQVIYWGHLPSYDNLAPMYLFVNYVFKFYKEKGKKILDIGPSSENSQVNNGLFYFKRSIGCDTSLKYSFIKD